jgi:hypothetical protein
VTLDEALQKAGRLFDEHAFDRLVAAEDVLRSHGAEPEEIDLELSRMKAEHEDARRQMLALVSATWQTPSSWPEKESGAIH